VFAAGHTVDRVSETSVSRAAVFAQQLPDVEVCLDGSWRHGSILGWWHDEGGACEVRVRAVVAGAPCEVWVDLASLRLPEQPAPEPSPATVALVLTPQDAPRGAREALAPSPATVTLSRAAARERLVAGVLATPERSADGGSATRRRRHGGDVTAEMPAVSAGTSSGRHRAGAGGGRHRAADEDPRAEEAGPAAVPVVATRPEPDRLTRPLRLGNRTSRPRLPRPAAVVRI
jgi:hypothetical protein